MKNLNVLILVVGALVLSAYACKQSKNVADSGDQEKTEMSKEMTDQKNEMSEKMEDKKEDMKDKKDQMSKGEKESKVQNVIVDPTYMAKSTDNFTLLESNLHGDILTLLVQYGGGCETHAWALKTNGAYAKSLPPQITLNLEHNANGDMCRALLTDTLEFDLSAIKYPGTFQLMVKLKDFEKHTITYKYN